MKRLPILFLAILMLAGCGDPLTEAVGHFIPEDPEVATGSYERDRAHFQYQYDQWLEKERRFHNMEEVEDGLTDETEVYNLLRIIRANAHTVKWVSDGVNSEGKKIDTWSSLQEFIDNNYQGDCEDIAHYYYWLIRKTRAIPDSNVSVRIVDNYSAGSSGYHVIVAILTDGRTFVISNGYIHREQSVHTSVCMEYNIFTSWWR